MVRGRLPGHGPFSQKYVDNVNMAVYDVDVVNIEVKT
jgi:hypothetical protein